MGPSSREVSKIQTFLPYPDFRRSVDTLDNMRLGKQRVESFQIMQAITGIRHIPKLEQPVLEDYTPKGWTRHPVAVMWRGHLDHLMCYQIATCDAWAARGYRDTCESKTLLVFVTAVARGIIPQVTTRPWWLGDDRLHRSHRSNLSRKLPERYQQLWPEEPDDLPYQWPDHDGHQVFREILAR